jgi:hypothetical protein
VKRFNRLTFNRTMYRVAFTLFLLLLGYRSFGQNILISNEGFPNEPSIMMDPQNPNVILAGANINRYYVSLDTGRTWTTNILQSPYGVWGDPAIAVDNQGHFYFFHLSNPQDGHWIDRIVCQKTTDQGKTWNEGSYTGLNGTKAQDKQWFAFGPDGQTIYLTWTQFDNYGSSSPGDSSSIMFSKSVDAGETWSPALRINQVNGDCIDSDNTVEGAVPTIGPNGEIYVAWAGPEGIVFDRSLDQGETWLAEDIKVDPMPTGWDYRISGINRSNGLPITICDLSNGPHRGTIYINWSDQRNGANDTDVWLAKSEDGGTSWSNPVRVNNDGPGSQQFFTWMDIDQTTGYLYFVFYDRRDLTGDNTHVYLAVSQDGGNTFINRRISEEVFVPNDGVFFGDYTNITVHDGIVRPIWTRLHKGKLSIWTHLTTTEALITSSSNPGPIDSDIAFENYPNPSVDIVYVSFKLHERSIVNLSLLNSNGAVLKEIIPDQKRGYGKYVEEIHLNDLHITPGIYFIQLEIDGKLHTERQVIVE